MAPKLTKKQKKSVYIEKLKQLLKEYKQILVISADNVGSKQITEVRVALRGKGQIVFGKNTLMRTALRYLIDEEGMTELEALLDLVKLNIGFVFVKGDIAEVRKIILSNKVPSPAKQGMVAQMDVWVHAGPTGLDPGQTSFFQTVGIATKLVKSQIDIVADVHVCKVGTRVTASQAAILAKLDIRPFEFGLNVQTVYDNGEVYSADVLDITDEDLKNKFLVAVQNTAAFSLGLNYPTLTSVPYLLKKAYKNAVALVVDSDYTFPQIEMIKAYLADPSAFAAAAGPADGGAADAGAAAAVEEEEEEEAFEFDLF